MFLDDLRASRSNLLPLFANKLSCRQKVAPAPQFCSNIGKNIRLGIQIGYVITSHSIVKFRLVPKNLVLHRKKFKKNYIILETHSSFCIRD